MAGSLQDQLLSAGLIKDQDAKNIKAKKRKAEKQSRKNNTELENEAAKLAEAAREEQRRKSQELNAQRREEIERKAIAAQIKQIIEMNTIPKGKGDDLLAYNFTDFNKVKTIYVTPKNHDLIARGRLAIARLNDAYHLIPAEAANKIIERDAATIALLNDPMANTDAAVEDDPYAEFQIPDDLMW
ncbi:MAG: nucleoprotein/polynucleotide-associated enzyme [Proteobacteria bacterium]|nr:MAG: nucleoprotein/polynucleotide-associated enzyme [Pseudomonadota bacterium]